MRWFSILFSAILIGGACASAAPRPAREMVALLSDLHGEMKALERSVGDKKSGPETQKILDGLRGTFRELGQAKPEKGSPDLLQQYAEAGAGMLTSVERSVQHDYWPEARAGLDQVKGLVRDIDRDYSPGWWARFKYRLKRLF